MRKPHTEAHAARREPLNIRTKPEEHGLIDQAATLRGKTRTDFILDAAGRADEETLPDSTLFAVSPAAYQAFLERLDAQPKPNDRLRRTMQTVPSWE